MTEEAIARHPEPGLDIFGSMRGAVRPGLDLAIETSMEHRVQVPGTRKGGGRESKPLLEKQKLTRILLSSHCSASA